MSAQIVEYLQDLQLTTGSLFLGASGLLALYFVTYAIYNVFFHPLAKYPGPPLAKVTNWYAIHHADKGDMQRNMYALHQKYGKYVRYAPNRLLVNSATAVRDVYAHSKPLKKSTTYIAMRADINSPSTQQATDKVEHGRKRKLLSYGFSDASLRGYEPLILERVQKFCQIMGEGATEENKGWSEARNISDWSNYLTFDIMAAVVFGKPFHMLESEKDRPFCNAIENAARCANIILNTPWAGTKWGHKLRKLPILMLVPYKKLRGFSTLFSTGARICKERREADEKTHPKDIFSYILAARDPETGLGFNELELNSEARLLIVAGSDTSSACMSAAVFFLSRNPATLAKLVAELDEHFKSLSEIIPSKTNACHYLRAVIDEALRLAPPVGSTLWRETQKNGTIVDDITLPEGVDVGVPIYAVQHHAEYYPDPFAFKPERWLEMNSDAPGYKAFCAFSIGPRGCVGKSLAYAELYLMLARTVYMYDIKVVDATGEMYTADGQLEYRTFDTFTTAKDGPVLQFRKRQAAVLDE